MLHNGVIDSIKFFALNCTDLALNSNGRSHQMVHGDASFPKELVNEAIYNAVEDGAIANKSPPCQTAEVPRFDGDNSRCCCDRGIDKM